MIKIFKSNKLITIFLFIMCIVILFNPTIYAKSCLNAISVWAFKVLPLMLPFFILTRLIAELSQADTSPVDRLFNKLYGTSSNSFSTFFLSLLCGYPMGAKLIGDKYSQNIISKNEAKTMLSFCSISGPIFIVGTVGVLMLNSFKAGVIIFISNIIASLINGIIYRNKPRKPTPNNTDYKSIKNGNKLGDCVYSSLISVLMIGAYIVLSFLIIDILKNLNIITIFSFVFSKIFNVHIEVLEAIICGFFEITRGCLDISNTNVALSIKSIIISTIIAFGGISIILQSSSFLSSLNVSIKTMIKQKLTQALICLLISIPLCLIFL